MTNFHTMRTAMLLQQNNPLSAWHVQQPNRHWLALALKPWPERWKAAVGRMMTVTCWAETVPGGCPQRSLGQIMCMLIQRLGRTAAGQEISTESQSLRTAQECVVASRIRACLGFPTSGLLEELRSMSLSISTSMSSSGISTT